MTADGDRFLEKHVDESMNGMEMHIARHIEGDKMIVVRCILQIFCQFINPWSIFLSTVWLRERLCFLRMAIPNIHVLRFVDNYNDENTY
jgi:hypothetical protein